MLQILGEISRVTTTSNRTSQDAWFNDKDHCVTIRNLKEHPELGALLNCSYDKLEQDSRYIVAVRNSGKVTPQTTVDRRNEIYVIFETVCRGHGVEITDYTDPMVHRTITDVLLIRR